MFHKKDNWKIVNSSSFLRICMYLDQMAGIWLAR